MICDWGYCSDLAGDKNQIFGCCRGSNAWLINKYAGQIKLMSEIYHFCGHISALEWQANKIWHLFQGLAKTGNYQLPKAAQAKSCREILKN